MTKRSEVRSPLVEIHTNPSSVILQNGFRPRFRCYPVTAALLWLLSDVFWHGVGQVGSF